MLAIISNCSSQSGNVSISPSFLSPLNFGSGGNFCASKAAVMGSLQTGKMLSTGPCSILVCSMFGEFSSIIPSLLCCRVISILSTAPAQKSPLTVCLKDCAWASCDGNHNSSKPEEFPLI